MRSPGLYTAPLLRLTPAPLFERCRSLAAFFCESLLGVERHLADDLSELAVELASSRSESLFESASFLLRRVRLVALGGVTSGSSPATDSEILRRRLLLLAPLSMSSSEREDGDARPDTECALISFFSLVFGAAVSFFAFR